MKKVLGRQRAYAPRRESTTQKDVQQAVKEAMKEYDAGTLKDASGRRVTDPREALAIGAERAKEMHRKEGLRPTMVERLEPTKKRGSR